jgi:hypothetical protein
MYSTGYSSWSSSWWRNDEFVWVLVSTGSMTTFIKCYYDFRMLKKLKDNDNDLKQWTFVSNGRAVTKAAQRNESIWFCGGVDGKYEEGGVIIKCCKTISALAERPLVWLLLLLLPLDWIPSATMPCEWLKLANPINFEYETISSSSFATFYFKMRQGGKKLRAPTKWRRKNNE